MSKRCLSYTKGIHPSFGVDVTLQYCVKNAASWIMKSSLSAHRKYSTPYENWSSMFWFSNRHLLKLSPLFSGPPLFQHSVLLQLDVFPPSNSRFITAMGRAINESNKKFELMLTRRTKAHSSSCSQTVSQSLALSSQFYSFLECVLQPKIAKINKTPYFGSTGSFIVIDVDTTKKLVTSTCCDKHMQMVICNHFHERLANNGKIMTFTVVPLFDALMHRFPWI